VAPLAAQVAVKGKKVYTLAGPPIEDGMVIVRDGRIIAVGEAAALQVPEGFRVLEAEVVTPGLIDAHTAVGLSGQYNYEHDRDQLERSAPMQPELRALDAYNPLERLVGWVRSFGVTTVHTGHAPGELISGQTMVVKTTGKTVEDAVIVPEAMVAATLGPQSTKDGDGSPGTRGKQMALLRARLLQARDYARKLREASASEARETPAVDLALAALAKVLARETPLLVTAHRAQDIATALRLAEEFDFELVLDGAAESYLLVERIREAAVPVILHPTMARPSGELESASFETAAKLREAGIPTALQSGYESYVPKARVVLFEAAIAAANGLGLDGALAAVTIDAARILGIDDRVGSLVVGKDGDLALYDGDPFEYTTHCVGVVIEGEVVSDAER
jgi:imidazolonepropionase-like amidohydrolase